MSRIKSGTESERYARWTEEQYTAFVKAWAGGASSTELAAKLGISLIKVRNVAVYLRKRGVKLPSQRHGGQAIELDVKALNQLALAGRK